MNATISDILTRRAADTAYIEDLSSAVRSLGITGPRDHRFRTLAVSLDNMSAADRAFLARMMEE